MNKERAMAFFVAAPEKNGWTQIYVVDEHGCLLHTEPVCSVPTKWGHRWFTAWLIEDVVAAPVSMPSLLEHESDIVLYHAPNVPSETNPDPSPGGQNG